jgi:hypothetical protein
MTDPRAAQYRERLEAVLREQVGYISPAGYVLGAFRTEYQQTVREAERLRGIIEIMEG